MGLFKRSASVLSAGKAGAAGPTDGAVGAHSGGGHAAASGTGAAGDGAGNVDLLIRFREGDALAFEEIVGRYELALVNFFYRLCWDKQEAEDLAQEVFFRIFKSSRQYVSQGRFSTFLYRVASNLWIDHYRSRRPRPRLYSIDQPAYSGADMAESRSAQDLAADAPGPSQQAERDEEQQILRQAVERLTEPHRLVFELAHYQKLPYDLIAETLGIPVGTVKSRMHNAVQFLRAAVRGAGNAGDGADAGGRSAGHG